MQQSFKVYFQVGDEIRFDGTYDAFRAGGWAQHFARMFSGACITTSRGKVTRIVGKMDGVEMGSRIVPKTFAVAD